MSKQSTWLSVIVSSVAMVLLFQNCGGRDFTTLSSTGLQAQASIAPPTLVISEAPPVLSNLRSFDFKFSAKASPAASVQLITCTLDSGPAQPCTNGFTALNLMDGDHVLKVKAQDSFGTSSDEVVYLWKVDATKPIVTINQKPATVTGMTSVSFAFSGNEASNFFCAMDNEAMALCVSPVTRTLSEGTHAFKIQAIDDAKNSSDVVTSSFKVDLTAPALNILTKPAVLIGTNTSSFTFSGTDDGMTISVFSCKLDNQAATVCNAGSVSYANLTEGSHTFSLSGQDSAGNLSTAVTYTWSVDLTAPTTPVVTADVPASTKNTTATFIFSATDLNGIKSFECQIDTGSFAACTSPKIYSGLALGNHTFSVRAKDQVDNLSTASSFAWTITAPPTPTPTPTPTGNKLPVGTLAHDGPPTPEQISLILPVTGALPMTAKAAVRYKVSNTSAWITGHPLYRIRPTLSDTPDVGSVPDAFAWPIIDLTPGTSYDVEVTLTSGTDVNILNATFVTRSLPLDAGVPNKTITAGSSSSTIQAVLDGLNPGDVVQFQNGTYKLSSALALKRGGTASSPIYIRGASRAGVILSNPERIIQIQNSSHVVIENMTLQGSGVDSGTAARSEAVAFYDGTPNQTRITVRNITMTGVDTGIGADAEILEFLAYDNTLLGNNTWTSAFIDTNLTWNDDAIRIPGFGNCAFNNTIKGFGDSTSFAQHYKYVIGVHFYRNDILMGGDDGVEVDEGQRNLTFYDNRMRNTMSFVSLDPVFGGPLVVARNIAINIGRTPFKWNSKNSGHFVFNNTILRTTGQYWVESPGSAAEAGWYQPGNGDQSSYGYQNNIMVYRGAGDQMIRLDNSGHSPVDFTNNSWYPNLVFQWPEYRFANLLAAINGLANTIPVFSGSTRRMQNDNITTSNPWTTMIALGTDYHTEVTTGYIPILSAGSAPKNSGVIIPNITDGFSGSAPDRGAIIEGRPIPQYGDRK